MGVGEELHRLFCTRDSTLGLEDRLKPGKEKRLLQEVCMNGRAGSGREQRRPDWETKGLLHSAPHGKLLALLRVAAEAGSPCCLPAWCHMSVTGQERALDPTAV